MRANGFFIVICSLAIAHAAPVFGHRRSRAEMEKARRYLASN